MSVGGTIVATKKNKLKNKTILSVMDKTDYTLVDAELDHDLKRGDKIWWQAGFHYWTRPGEFTEKKIKKVGYSRPWYG